MRTWMKPLCATLVVLLAVGAAAANCGVKDTHEGTLKSVDAENNAIVVSVGADKTVELQLTDSTAVKDADGKTVEVSKLVGSKVKVISEHSKIDSIQALA